MSPPDPHDIWYFRVRELAAPYEINVDTDEAHQDELALFVNYRVLDYQGKLLGVTGTGLTADAVQQLIDRYQDRYQRNVYFTDRQGRITLHGKGPSAPAGDIHAVAGLSDQAEAILGKNEGSYQYSRDGLSFQLNVRWVPELDWYLWVEKAEDEAFSAIRQTLFLNLGICFFITLVVLLLTRFSINQYQRRLKDAVDSHTAQLDAALNAARHAHQSLTQVMAFIGHDLRAPLATIVHYAQLLGRNKNVDVSQYQHVIERSAMHQLELIDDLVEHARGELEQLELLPCPGYFHDWLAHISAQAQLLAEQQGNVFSLQVSPTLPPVLVFDAKRLRQVLLNLLTNAAKFTHAGQISLNLQASPLAEGKVALDFAVADSGPGIAPEDLARIFLPFERCQGEQAQGYGLGLSIAHQLVAAMGGELQVASTPGQGSRFFFRLTLTSAEEGEVRQPVKAFALPEPFGSGKTLLVVDDNAASRDYLQEVLHMADFDVVCAANGTAALQLAKEQTFAAMLVDQSMPDMSGWTLLRQLHEAQPGALPLMILCSAMPPQRPEDYPDGLDFAATLLKPVPAETLLQLLQGYFEPADEHS